MNRKEIMEGLKGLSKVNHFYYNLYQDYLYLYENDIVKYNELMEDLEKEHFKDIVDLIIYIEW